MPMLITATPCACGGISRSATLVGWSVMPNIPGIEKPWMSASITPTRRPSAAMAAARFAVTVDLPTPPLPEETRSEEHTSELQSRFDLVCRLLLEKKKDKMHRE